MGSVIGIPVEEVWEAYGGFLIQFTMETGWNELLRALSPDLEFIDHVVYRTKLKGPAFRCEAQPDGSLILHYYSRRSGLYPIVKGVIREVARRIYETEVIMKVQERKQEHVDSLITEHVVFVINQVENSLAAFRSIASRTVSSSTISSEFTNVCSNYYTKIDDFCKAFPHHFCFDKELRIEHVGKVHPEIPLSFDSIMAFRNSLFVFRLRDELSQGSSKPSSCRSDEVKSQQMAITIKGSMHLVAENKYMVYMCSLNVTTIRH
ncbi:unnamed protein product [Meloidogyne enterolobii]|uniref:Uncharacterized protein n=1 Tax=Meloidogyne enterolobii TaxID=390850 RepID=A0ACB0YJS2_MELEN